MSADKPNPQCQDCKWWQAYKPDDDDDSSGFCNRYPPQLAYVTGGPWVWISSDRSCRFPDVDAFDFCGEHTPIDP